jgi:hypothetical protein
MHTIEPDHAEQDQGLSVEQASVEDTTNLLAEQGKPWCIAPLFIDFGFAK